MKKKKICFHSNGVLAFTGFGKHMKNIIKYLYKTGKYEIVEMANGSLFDDAVLNKRPWKAVGTLPNNPALLNELNRDPARARQASYGNLMLEEIIKEEKPDIYVATEDPWMLNEGTQDKKWWKKINTMVHTTIDSVPILPWAKKLAKKTDHFYTWASFGAREMNKEEGLEHVGLLRGAIDTSTFFPLAKSEKQDIRKKYNIGEEDFVIGFVFRNQLRKSVPNLLEGFKEFTNQNPEIKAKLLLHTHWAEGWNIEDLIKEKGIDPELVLTTYFCKECKEYEIKPFEGQGKDCGFCGAKEKQNTTNVKDGVDEEQLNEIYNIMDVYCHPFTSGGQEIPIQEAKLTEKISLVTNYSCGEDCCTPESGGLPLEWAEYREPGTQFIKASTYASSICKQLKKVYKMKPEARREMEKKSRQWVIDNFSVEVIGKQMEEIFDSMPEVEWDFNFESEKRNPEYRPPEVEDNVEWLIDIYKNILCMEVDKDDDGLKYWMSQFEKGSSRETVLEYFRKVAFDENQKMNTISIEDVFDKTGNKRALLVLKESEEDIFAATSLLKSFKESYEDYDIYFACKPEYSPLLQNNPYIHKVLPYHEVMDNEYFMIGAGQEKEKKLVDFYCNLSVSTKKHLNHLSNDIKILKSSIYE